MFMFAAMPPRVDLAARQAMEAATATQAVERKKKRLAMQASQCKLKMIYKGSRVDPAGVKLLGKK